MMIVVNSPKRRHFLQLQHTPVVRRGNRSVSIPSFHLPFNSLLLSGFLLILFQQLWRGWAKAGALGVIVIALLYWSAAGLGGKVSKEPQALDARAANVFKGACGGHE